MERKFSQIIKEVEKELSKNESDWLKRYSRYAKEINENLSEIEKNKDLFQLHKSIRPFMELSQATRKMSISLRFKGTRIAELNIKKDKVLLISTKGFENANKYFGCTEATKILNNTNWNDDTRKASNFRSFYKHCTKESYKVEHEIESLLKDRGFVKHAIVQIAKKYNFQFPTPLGASKSSNSENKIKTKKILYSGKNGGGIDILARDRSKNLCVIELKQVGTKDSLEMVLGQALAYATFLRQLLKSHIRQDWYEILGINRKIPDKLKIKVISLMDEESINKEDLEHIPKSLVIDGKDEFIFQSWFYKKKKKCSVNDIESVYFIENGEKKELLK